MAETTVTPVIAMELLCGDAPCRAPLTSNIVMVLKKVDQLGSLSAATKRLHMGYSNTLYAICGIEEALGCKLLERTCSKGSVLTDEGRYLINLYEKTQSKTEEFAISFVAHDAEPLGNPLEVVAQGTQNADFFDTEKLQQGIKH